MKPGDIFIVKTRIFEVNENITLKKDDLIIFLEESTKNGLMLVTFWNHYGGTILMRKSQFLTHCKRKYVRSVCQQLNNFSDEERCELFSLFCKHCGSKDNKCKCWNDE